MLILHRRLGETLTLRLSDDIDPSTPVGEIFGAMDVVVELKWLGETSASLGIEAPPEIKVLRTELLKGDQEPDT